MLSLLMLASCGNGDSAKDAPDAAAPKSDAKNTSAAPTSPTVKWPENDFTAGLPKPTTGNITKVADNFKGGKQIVITVDWTNAQAKQYGEALSAAGVPGNGAGGEPDAGYMFRRSPDDSSTFNGRNVEIGVTGYSKNEVKPYQIKIVKE